MIEKNASESKTLDEVLNSDLFHNSVKMVEDMMGGYDPSHDAFHVKRVLALAIHIYKTEFINDQNVDPEIVVLSALFHDAADFKYGDATSREQTLNKLVTFLENNAVASNKIEKVLYIIDHISYRKELECENITMYKELIIVRDSDRLEALGAIGVARCFGYTCMVKRPFYDPNVQLMENMTAEEYNKQTASKAATAYTHFFEKLFKLKDRMCTETGRQMALQRHRFMIEFISQFENEMNVALKY